MAERTFTVRADAHVLLFGDLGEKKGGAAIVQRVEEDGSRFPQKRGKSSSSAGSLLPS